MSATAATADGLHPRLHPCTPNLHLRSHTQPRYMRILQLTRCCATVSTTTTRQPALRPAQRPRRRRRRRLPIVPPAANAAAAPPPPDPQLLLCCSLSPATSPAPAAAAPAAPPQHPPPHCPPLQPPPLPPPLAAVAAMPPPLQQRDAITQAGRQTLRQHRASMLIPFQTCQVHPWHTPISQSHPQRTHPHPPLRPPPACPAPSHGRACGPTRTASRPPPPRRQRAGRAGAAA